MGLDEMAGIFILFTIITGLVAGFGPNQIAETFIEGCSQVVNGALICGVARAILVVLQEGNIIDSVIYGLSQPLTLFPSWLCSVGMVAVQTLINFFIPSGTGQAAVTMPIFAPIARYVRHYQTNSSIGIPFWRWIYEYVLANNSSSCCH